MLYCNVAAPLPTAVMIPLAWPLQRALVPAKEVMVGSAFTVTMVDAEAVQPRASVTETV